MATWKRPSSVPPQIWLREKGIVVRDVTPDLDEFVIDLMSEIHSREAPLSRSLGLYNDKASREDMRWLWRELTLPQRVSLVALAEGTPGANMEPVSTENPPVLLGANVLMVSSKSDPDQQAVLESAKGLIFKKLFLHMKKFGHDVDVFEKFQVDHYLDAIGLSVDGKSRGRGIGEMLLRARRPLCERLGIPATKTVFSSAAAQKIAGRVGFQVVKEVPFSKMTDEAGQPAFPDISDGVQGLQLCVWKFN